VASAEVRLIRRRIRSVESTMKITRAMELIAAIGAYKASIESTGAGSEG
jgi:F0F1-type ATP synthase gamma subunit